MAAIIVTGVFRFNYIGKYTSYSMAPSAYSGTEFDFIKDGALDLTTNLSDSSTYQSDASLIVWIWSLQIFFFLFSCCCLVPAVRPDPALMQQSLA